MRNEQTHRQEILVPIHPGSNWEPGIRQYDKHGNEVTSIAPRYADVLIKCDICNEEFHMSDMTVNDYAEKSCPSCGNENFYFKEEQFRYKRTIKP